jgi:hypothetical protein
MRKLANELPEEPEGMKGVYGLWLSEAMIGIEMAGTSEGS